MSLLLDTAELTYLNDNGTEDLYLSEDENEDYNFKYVPANHFKYIVKDVRRQRCREEEESVWASFVKQQELNDLACNQSDIQPSVQSIKELLDEGMRKADKELKRLETDIFTNGISNEYDRTKSNQKRKSEVNNIRDSSLKKMPTTKDSGTGSTNLLLTIPEEENTPIYERKHEPDSLKTYVRKSCSNHVTTRRKQSSKQMHHATNGIEYNSSPEISTRRNDNADGIICIRPDPFVMHKILTMQRRVCELLDEIAFRLVNIPAPDGIKDLQRRQQCAAEFAVRFSRNYLYDLNRYVKEIRRHMYIISPRARVRPNRKSLGLHMHAIEHKLLATHQLLLHALVAYCNHIPSSILKGHPGKFREILQVVIDLKTMCDRLHLNTNYLDSGDNDILSLGKDIESKCNVILSKLKLHSDNDLLDSNNKTPSITSFTSHSAHNKKHINRKQLSNRLSMYSTDTKISKNYPRQKANYYHQKNKNYNRRDIKKSSNALVPTHRPYSNPVIFTPTKDVNQARIRKHRTYAKEEDIKTVMDMLPVDSDNGSNFEPQERRGNATLTRRRLKTSKKLSSGKPQNLEQSETIEAIVRTTSTNNDDELLKRVTMITEEHLSNLVPVIADLMSFVSNKQNGSEARPVSTASVKTLMNFLQRHQSPKSANARISADAISCDMCRSSTDSSCECNRLKTNRILTETQKDANNMQLICMSSMEDTLKTLRYRHISCQVSHESLEKSPEIKAREEQRMTDSFDSIELTVSKETENNFLKYKREYQRLTQSIPMYSSSTQNKPWDIVAWISDKLVDELITEIANELVMEDVIQKLFDMEFREF